MIYNNFSDIKKKYKIIYADPPWTFKVRSDKGKGRSAENHYNCMSKEEIQNLDVASICERDAILFLWVTPPCLEEGLELIKKWGFTYKTKGFNWVKTNKNAVTREEIVERLKSGDNVNKIIRDIERCSLDFMGMGYLTRSNSEDCLIASRGVGMQRVSKSVKQLAMSKIREHSRKPDEIRERIVELLGDVPRLEMFGRQEFPGWDVFGNEVDKF